MAEIDQIGTMNELELLTGARSRRRQAEGVARCTTSGPGRATAEVCEVMDFQVCGDFA